MRKKILMTSLVLLSLSGCQNAKENQAEHDAKIAAQAKAELRAELEEARRQKEAELQKNNKLGHMGISTDDGKLIIDTHKTKDFLQQMAEKMKDHADKFSKDFEKGVIDDKEAGIEMNQTHINIDLNKTKSFLENWEKTLEGYAKEFNKMTQEYSKELKKDTNAAN
ncbi:MAG TPA: hypothetical protein EYG78_06930 [Sulfurovum sp.]|nr:hypothetical protein [Sulfurovum sp.]